MNIVCRKHRKITGYLSTAFVFLALSSSAFTQCPDYRQAVERLKGIEADTAFSFPQKIKALHQLRNEFEKCRLVQDSVLARIFNRIGFYEYRSNNNVASNTAVASTLTAIDINRHAKKGSSVNLALNCYNNLGVYYSNVFLYYKALDYFDSSILIARTMPEKAAQLTSLRFNRISAFLEIGDYQKAVEESTTGLAESVKNNDSLSVLRFLSQRAQSYYFQQQLRDALTDAEQTIQYAGFLNDDFEKASAHKIKALVNARYNNLPVANSLFKEAIKVRLKIGDIDYQIADDYTDYGNFFLNDMHDYARAKSCYGKTIEFANKANDAERLAKAYLNSGVVSYHQGNYQEALQYNATALSSYKAIAVPGNLLMNPPASKLTALSNKELLLSIFNNKTEVLLTLFKRTNNKQFLNATLQTAMLTDTLITHIRHEQRGELSKLYWRNRTREFFTNAIEACYLDNNTRLAFLFMEKSKAVLLNDKMNEIGAAAHLPEAEAGIERQFQIRVITNQQKLNALSMHSAAYHEQMLVLLAAKDSMEHYIRSLEKRFPVYFQYKYDDNIPSLDHLQHYLSGNNQSFVHYFINDTAAYMVCISPRNTKMIRLAKKDFNYDQISRFAQLCADNITQNLHYDSFAALSHTLYNLYFRPMQITESRVIICPDNFLLPFEALCSDGKGEHFLNEKYAFSYVYSARYLFKAYKAYPAEGNFIGFAPRSFRQYLHVPPLNQSVKALKQASAYYKSARLFTLEVASKYNFLENISRYSVVNVFTHAYADTSNNEPVLYMQDSVIHLSELQRSFRQAARLVVLSACQTNVGRKATGEGIYSLARGFASAGIPSVAATCWEADEPATYAVSLSLHEYIARGMSIDVAMQKAKSDFLKKNIHTERSLPYFWANMVIIGNAEPVKLNTVSHKGWWLLAAGVAIILLLIVWYRKRNPA